MKCPEREEIERYVNGELGARRFSIAQKHLRECAACTEVAENCAIEKDVLREALRPPPDVERMISDVLRRLRDDRP